MSDLERTITAFLIDRKVQGLSPTTIKAYTHELNTFQRYLGDTTAMDDDKIGQMCLWIRLSDNNRAIQNAAEGKSSFGGAVWVASS